ncbi:tetratricopeptide repeat protein [Streptomyces sp. NPDC002668]|uniref:tetratricopeptide repeat protein n=1 Tax=Streptomyces sp. NPDC002668 TaxID=3154422 RepID=UPI003316DE3B
MTGADPLLPGQPAAAGKQSIAAGSIGVAISGDGARVVMLPPEAVRWAQDIPAPPGAGNLPGSASGLFLGRDEELLQLRDLLSGQGEATAVTQTRAIHGLGGVGKSTLALHYAHRYRAEYALVWWITAESPGQITAGLADLAGRLCPQWAVSAGLDERAAWAMLWLQWHPGWLLVFDNVEDPDDLRLYLGALTGGHHVATSRKATGWQAIAPTMTLGLLDPAASADLLCALALDGCEHSAKERRQAEALARDLGYLPLALEQAGAYLHQTGTEMDTYRQRLGLMLTRAADGINQERTIARVWDQTLTAISARDPLAVTVLHTLAWLAPEDLPRTLLTDLAPDPDALDEALGVLHAYNMVTFSGPGVSVHRLVQTVLLARAQEIPSTSPLGRQEAEQTILHALPSCQEDVPTSGDQWQRFIPHVIALAISTPPGHTSDDAITCYGTTTDYMTQQGQEVRATPLYEATLAQCERVLGDTHPDTLISRNDLAVAYRAAGDLQRAIPLFEATLAQRERVLGDTHPDTLISRNDLAVAYREAGDLQRAIPLLGTALAQCEQALGDIHPDTLSSRNDLARAYHSAGDLQHAIPLYEATLAQRERVLGDTHPDTLISRNNLAGAYMWAGDLERATPLFETTLAQCKRVLGDTHPDTLMSRNNLASAYRRAGDLERATPLYETTLAQREQALGDTHPDTLFSRDILACAYMWAGDLKRAAPLFEANLAQCERVLGDTHPLTLTCRYDLAHAYQSAGDLERAIPLFEATLAQRERVLGDTHPDTLISCYDLAQAYQSAGDLQRAIPLFEANLAQRERVLGDTHPDTLINRASAYRAVQAEQQSNTPATEGDGRSPRSAD